jgi:hypothetical protein
VRADAFRLKTMMREHFEQVCTAVGARTERNAIFISLVHTGSLRYYAHRESLRFDVLPERVDEVIDDLQRHAYVPYILLRQDELPLFRSRFGADALGWRPTPVDKDGVVLLFDPRQRAGARRPGV